MSFKSFLKCYFYFVFVQRFILFLYHCSFLYITFSLFLFIISLLFGTQIQQLSRPT